MAVSTYTKSTTTADGSLHITVGSGSVLSIDKLWDVVTVTEPATTAANATISAPFSSGLLDVLPALTGVNALASGTSLNSGETFILRIEDDANVELFANSGFVNTTTGVFSDLVSLLVTATSGEFTVTYGSSGYVTLAPTSTGSYAGEAGNDFRLEIESVTLGETAQQTALTTGGLDSEAIKYEVKSDADVKRLIEKLYASLGA